MGVLLDKRATLAASSCGALIREFCRQAELGGDAPIERERNLIKWAREKSGEVGLDMKQ